MYPYRAPKTPPYQTAPSLGQQPDRILLDLLQEAIADEATDTLYYGKLSKAAASAGDADIIRQVQADEKKHLKVLTDIYQAMAGEAPSISAEDAPVGANLRAEYEKRVLEELDGAEFYRKLYLMHKSPEYRDLFFEIMTDETAHAVKMLYLSGRA